MPTLALSTGSLYTYGIARVFELAAQASFDAVEILVDHRWDSRQPAYLRRLCQETGLPVAAIHSPFVPYVPAWPHDPLDRLYKSVALAQELQAGVVVTHLPLRIRAAKLEFFGARAHAWLLPILLPNQGDYRRFLLNGLAQFESAQDLCIGVENMPAKRFLGRRVSIFALNDLERLACVPHVTLDTTHLGTWGLDPLAVYERLKMQVVHVHLSNFNGEEHRLPEDGHLPLGNLLQRLVRDGYRGAISLEFSPDALEAGDEARALSHLQRAVQFCRKHLSLEEPLAAGAAA
jgi:sugar phosphate isomerase/epimerase